MKSSLGCLDTLFFVLLFLIVSLLSCEIDHLGYLEVV
jgi:hypothetical protein